MSATDREELEQALAERALAVRDHDETAFLASVDHTNEKFWNNQQRLIRNLVQLPLAAYDYEVTEVSSQASGQMTIAANIVMQLGGYDVIPVRTPARFEFANRSGTWRMVGFVSQRQPWDMAWLQIRRRAHILGVFDRRSVHDAPGIMDAVQAGIDHVAAEVPGEWDRQVVLFALSDITMMASLEDLPGGNPARLDGVSFGVRARPGSSQLAGFRFVLHPRVLEHGGPNRNRLIRHELTHVALGARDDRVPTWLAEGIAEWVAIRPVAMRYRTIAREALDMAQQGIEALPTDADFNGDHSFASYGIARAACEYIVDTFGADTLWKVLDAMSPGTAEATQDDVLERLLGMNAAELAGHAGQQIIAEFG